MTDLPQCYVCHGSRLQQWTDDLDLPQAFDTDDQCLNRAVWEVCEGNRWEPMCSMHKMVLTDREDYQDKVEYRMLPYVIEEEEALLDAKVEFLFAKARQMARESPNYVPEDQRAYVTPNIDDALKKSLKDALRKK